MLLTHTHLLVTSTVFAPASGVENCDDDVCGKVCIRALLLEKDIVTTFATCISRLSFAALEACEMKGKQSYRARHCLFCTLVTSFQYTLCGTKIVMSLFGSGNCTFWTVCGIVRSSAWKKNDCVWYTYIHMYTHTHTCHRSISLSKRQQDVEQIININIYTIFTV